jgi:hypothetical protein
MTNDRLIQGLEFFNVLLHSEFNLIIYLVFVINKIIY